MPTRGLEVDAADGVDITSSAGDIKANALLNIKLYAKHGDVSDPWNTLIL